MDRKLTDHAVEKALLLRQKMAVKGLSSSRKQAEKLAGEFKELATGVSGGKLNKIMSIYMDGMVSCWENSHHTNLYTFPHIQQGAEILGKVNTSWTSGNGSIWENMAKSEEGEVCQTRVMLIREIVMLMAGCMTEEKDKKMCLRAVDQAEGRGLNILTPQGTSENGHYDQWRSFIPDILAFAAERYLGHYHAKKKSRPPLNISGADLVGMWRKTALLWNPDSPVILHAPVRKMALAGGRLSYAQTLEIDDLSGLSHDFIETMEEEAQGPARILTQRGEDQIKYLQIRSMARKKRLTDIVGEQVVEKHPGKHIKQSAQVKM